MKKVILATDHAGFALKEQIKSFLKAKGFVVDDFGTHSPDSCDYPDYIIPACEAVVKQKCFGIVFGGSGNGEAIAANKVKGVRATICYDLFTTKLSREHNDSNVLALGGRTATGNPALAKKIVLSFLTTEFSGESRHKRRLAKIAAYEGKKR